MSEQPMTVNMLDAARNAQWEADSFLGTGSVKAVAPAKVNLFLAVGPHQEGGRHTVATVMLEDGEAMNTVQEQLGHYDAGFTASRYGHVTAKMRNSAAVKLGERLEKVRNPEAEDEENANSVKKEDTIIPFQEGHKLKSAACKIK